jgi:hypothetical protein
VAAVARGAPAFTIGLTVLVQLGRRDQARKGRPTLEAMIIADENGKELMTVRAKDILPEPLK